MRIKIIQRNELIDKAIEIGNRDHSREYRFTHAYLLINDKYEIKYVELHYEDAIDTWKKTISIDQIIQN